MGILKRALKEPSKSLRYYTVAVVLLGKESVGLLGPRYVSYHVGWELLGSPVVSRTPIGPWDYGLPQAARKCFRILTFVKILM